jgi:hypothetical protein
VIRSQTADLGRAQQQTINPSRTLTRDITALLIPKVLLGHLPTQIRVRKKPKLAPCLDPVLFLHVPCDHVGPYVLLLFLKLLGNCTNLSARRPKRLPNETWRLQKRGVNQVWYKTDKISQMRIIYNASATPRHCQYHQFNFFVGNQDAACKMMTKNQATHIKLSWTYLGPGLFSTIVFHRICLKTLRSFFPSMNIPRLKIMYEVWLNYEFVYLRWDFPMLP